MTSAPRSASIMPARGPVIMVLHSTTETPARGLDITGSPVSAKRRGIAFLVCTALGCRACRYGRYGRFLMSSPFASGLALLVRPNLEMTKFMGEEMPAWRDGIV